MTVVQQILYTRQPQRWWALAEALGFRAPFAPTPEWGEFRADGVLAVHGALERFEPGRTDIHLLVPDLDAAAAALHDFTVARSEMAGVGEMLRVRASSGIEITVSAEQTDATGRADATGHARAAGHAGAAVHTSAAEANAAEANAAETNAAETNAAETISVQPIWFQEDLAEARAILTALGLRAGIAADRGSWVELVADGGSVGLHTGHARIGLSFEHRGDVDALAARLSDAGFDASVVDEAFARTIRIPDPDGGEEIWINAVQEDLYGYHREA